VVLILIIGSAASPQFLTGNNLFNLGLSNGEIAIMTLPMTLIIISGEIDLSVASILGMSSALLGYLWAKGWPMPAIFVFVAVVGIAAGAVNGLLVTRLRLPSLAVTIGTLALYRGIATIVLGPNTVSSFPAAYTNLGIAFTRTGKLDEAVNSLTKSVAIRPVNAMAQSNLAAALIEKGQTDEAVAHIRAALDADPEFADAHNMLGIILARAGKLDEAIDHLEKAVTNTPDSLEYRFNLGRVLAARSRFTDAIPHFEQAVKLSGGNEPQSLEMLAAMYSESGRYTDALKVARQALDLAERQGQPGAAQALRTRIAAYEAEAAKR